MRLLVNILIALASIACIVFALNGLVTGELNYRGPITGWFAYLASSLFLVLGILGLVVSVGNKLYKTKDVNNDPK